MSLLSSTTLFNFTDSFEHLRDNLLNGFHASTIYEKLPKRNNGYSVPMVCFCDIPLGMIKEHLDWYGKFGIGIKRSFARMNGVTPVFYLHSDHPHLASILNERNHNDAVLKLIPQMKQFIGNQSYRGRERRKKFYDEHEWRYIPPGGKMRLHLKQKTEAVKRTMPHDVFRMPLEAQAIEYIIIEDASHIDPLLKVFAQMKARDRKLNRELLISKIMTATQITRDF